MNAKDKRESWKSWATLRLQGMPIELFYWSVLLMSGGHGATFVANWLLVQPDRGKLQKASFHTLRTYLTPLHNIFAKGYTGSCPAYFMRAAKDAREWLDRTDEATIAALSDSSTRMYGSPIASEASPLVQTR